MPFKMNMEDPIEIVRVTINKNRNSATELYGLNRGRVFKVAEIMMGAGDKRRAVPYDKTLIEGAECRAEVLKNGRLRII